MQPFLVPDASLSEDSPVFSMKDFHESIGSYNRNINFLQRDSMKQEDEIALLQQLKCQDVGMADVEGCFAEELTFLGRVSFGLTFFPSFEDELIALKVSDS